MTSASVECARTSITDRPPFSDVVPEKVTSMDKRTRKAEEVLRLETAGKSADCIAEELGLSRASVLRVFRFVERASAA
ncbi:helix-turn-helix domain-containing protein [Rhizobium mongolense]|uniref:helix-turn-helix domain-containing protein n=1 Tax=Rhizobium mongolense TaxID=57676 RepID=UPI0034A21AA2